MDPRDFGRACGSLRFLVVGVVRKYLKLLRISQPPELGVAGSNPAWVTIHSRAEVYGALVPPSFPLQLQPSKSSPWRTP